jgi:hypothetical protein
MSTRKKMVNGAAGHIETRNSPRDARALVQGAFFLTTGLWPVAHYRSFERLTGAKSDDWLVKTTGGILAAIGLTLLSTRSSGRTLGMSTAAALAAADVVYVAKGRISAVYLIDAAVEAVLCALWLRRDRRSSRRSSKGNGRASKLHDKHP